MSLRYTMLVMTMSLTSIVAHAESTPCPAGTKLLITCTSTPKAGDNKILSQMFDNIDVCAGASKTTLTLEAGGQSTTGDAQPTVTTGATIYPIDEQITFIVSSRPGQDGTHSAKLNAPLGSTVASTTFTCSKSGTSRK